MTDPRQRVWELCQVDLAVALHFARMIEDGWRRCQSLSYVAWHTKSLHIFTEIVDETLWNARAMTEPFQTVAVSAWLVRAIVERADYNAEPVITELLNTIANEPNPVSRASALLYLFNAVYRKPPLRPLVLAPLMQACEQMRSWQQPRILRDIALVLADDDLASANSVIELITKPSIKQQAVTAIEKGEWLGPHEFFPSYTKVSA